jgi:hypothetical protein
MKALLFITLTLATTSTFAATKCPAETTQIENCKSTPQEGDNIVAGDMFKTIKVCKDNEDDSVTLVYIAPNGKGEAIESTESVRAGGTTYSTNLDEIKTTLSIKKGIRPGSSKENNATFGFSLKHVSDQLGAIEFASTYTCK